MKSLLSAAFMVVALFIPATARDLDGRYAQSPLKNWFDGLRSEKGLCCSATDGLVIRDVDWDTLGPEGRYRVFLEGEWVVVPPEAVIKVPNLAKVPMVWPYRDGNTQAIRCFMPGFTV